MKHIGWTANPPAPQAPAREQESAARALRFARLLQLTILIVGFLVAGCGSDAPSSPSSSSGSASSSVNLVGTWTGTGSDSSGPGTFTWNITQQNGNQISGTITFRNASNIGGLGAISGTLSGTTLAFTLHVPVGALPPPFSLCAISSDGSAQNVTASRISGTYTGTNSCSGPFNNGTLTMTK